MSIQSEIERISENIASTYGVLASEGATMPTARNSDNLPDTAASITAVLYGKAQTLTDAQKAQARANIGALAKADISLGIASDGLIYIFVNGAPVGTGIPQGEVADVYGYMDENNHIVLKGVKKGGAYTFAFVKDDDSTIYGGAFEYDDNIYYSVTNNLTNCTNSNSTKTVVEGESYTAVISPISGYKLSSVSVTMGGQAVSVSGGNINIASVTGDIVITAVAVEDKPAYTNLADPTSADWATDCRIGSDGGLRTGCTGGVVTNFIELHKGDVVRVKGIDLVNKIGTLNAHYVGIYNTSKGVESVAALTSQTANFSNITATETGGQATFTGGTGDVRLIRFAGKLNGTANDVIITVNEEIA